MAGASEKLDASPRQLAQQGAARAAVMKASASATGPKDVIVAVKVHTTLLSKLQIRMTCAF